MPSRLSKIGSIWHAIQNSRLFLPNGVPLQAGSLLKNLEFADSVQALAVQGAKALHTGKYAQNIVSVVQNAKDNPGQLSLQDLSDYQVVERPPVCVTYRIYEVCGMSAPSSGDCCGSDFGDFK